eukprot:SRR837773.23121.p1 GENE.SRR837773.23121~~SRR837773.23121.p1  ORF type:complete len:329 (+),score=24.73 SRR837773.23121:24-989(+)
MFETSHLEHRRRLAGGGAGTAFQAQLAVIGAFMAVESCLIQCFAWMVYMLECAELAHGHHGHGHGHGHGEGHGGELHGDGSGGGDEDNPAMRAERSRMSQWVQFRRLASVCDETDGRSMQLSDVADGGDEQLNRLLASRSTATGGFGLGMSMSASHSAGVVELTEIRRHGGHAAGHGEAHGGGHHGTAHGISLGHGAGHGHGGAASRRAALTRPHAENADATESLFRFLARGSPSEGKSGQPRLTAAGLRRYAALSGFDGGDAQWAVEFQELCSERGWTPEVGIDLEQFRSLTVHGGHTKYSLTSELSLLVGKLGLHRCTS